MTNHGRNGLRNAKFTRRNISPPWIANSAHKLLDVRRAGDAKGRGTLSLVEASNHSSSLCCIIQLTWRNWSEQDLLSWAQKETFFQRNCDTTGWRTAENVKFTRQKWKENTSRPISTRPFSSPITDESRREKNSNTNHPTCWTGKGTRPSGTLRRAQVCQYTTRGGQQKNGKGREWTKRKREKWNRPPSWSRSAETRARGHWRF